MTLKTEGSFSSPSRGSGDSTLRWKLVGRGRLNFKPIRYTHVLDSLEGILTSYHRGLAFCVGMEDPWVPSLPILSRNYLTKKQVCYPYWSMARIFRLTHNLLVPEGYWDNPENRRNYLQTFADKKGFDPLVATNWWHRASQLRASGVLLLLTSFLSTTNIFVHYNNLWLNRQLNC